MRLLITTFTLCISLIMHAQTDTIQMSLSQAMAYATEFGYQNRNANTDVEIAKKQVKEVLGTGLPQINASGSFTKNLALQENYFEMNGETNSMTFGTDYSTSIGGQVDQLIFNGSYFVGLKASKVYVKLSENLKEQTEIDIREAVSQAYFLVIVAQRNVDDFKKNLDTNEETLKETTAYYENGFREDTDVDQIRLLVNEAKQLYLEAQRQLNVTMTVLKFAMGYDIAKPLKVIDSMEDLLAPIPMQPGNEFNYETHISFQSMNTQVEIQDLAIKNQRAQAMPTLSAFYNYNYYYMGYELSDLQKSNGSAIGLSLSIPIFSGGSRCAKLKQEKLTRNKLEVQREQVAQSLKMDYMVAKSNLINSRMQFENSREARDIALRIHKKSLIKYQNGLLTSLELTQTENNLVQAHINYRQTSVQYFNNYLAYQKAINQL